jgi:hypothetical protein
MVRHLLARRKGEDVMSTMKGNMWRTAFSVVAGAVIIAGAVAGARADVASDKSGAILVYPKIVVDTGGIFGPPTDTEVQIVNTSNSVIGASCFLVNATAHCSNAPDVACTDTTVSSRCPIGGRCVPNWQKTDFRMTLTKRQPVSWEASAGLSSFPLDPNSTDPDKPHFGIGGQSNGTSSVPPAPEDPFFGEIKCVQADPQNFNPVPGSDPANNLAGDLAGEATIVSATGDETAPFPSVDARKYNALGIQAIAANFGALTANPNKPLCLGGNPSNPNFDSTDCPDGPEYNGCPNVLTLNHFFDDATITTHQGESTAVVTTDLTVVPCSEDFANDTADLAADVILQFLVFNEFEQRFSTSTSFACWKEVQLSDINTRPGPADNSFSIFNYAVQGTLSGQTRIRPVSGASTGNTVLGIAEEVWENENPIAQGTETNGAIGQFTTAKNIQFTGTRDLGDLLILGTVSTAP